MRLISVVLSQDDKMNFNVVTNSRVTNKYADLFL